MAGRLHHCCSPALNAAKEGSAHALLWLAYNPAKAAILDRRACLCICALLVTFQAAVEVMQYIDHATATPSFSVIGMLCLGFLVMVNDGMASLISANCWLVSEAQGMLSSA